MEWVFIISLFIVFYAYIGYGILISIIVKTKLFNANKTGESEYFPSVSLIIPCFNEVDYIEQKVKNSLELLYPKDKLEIIFIADGSDDGTEQVLAKYNEIKLMFEPERKGKASAMNRAVNVANGEIIVFCDANTDLNPEAIKELVKHYQSAEVGAVTGEKQILIRNSDGTSTAGEGLYWKYESYLKRKDSELWSVAGAAGELMSYRKSLYTSLEPDTLLDDFMQSMRVAVRNFRVIYEPKAIATETASANIKEELKRKIRIGAGGWQSITRLFFEVNPFKNFRLFFIYYSHRVLRWTLAPFALFLLIPLNLLIINKAPIYTISFAALFLFFLLALAGRLLEKKKIKIFFIPFYFVMMNYAIIAGFWRFVKKSQSANWERAKRA